MISIKKKKYFYRYSVNWADQIYGQENTFTISIYSQRVSVDNGISHFFLERFFLYLNTQGIVVIGCQFLLFVRQLDNIQTEWKIL